MKVFCQLDVGDFFKSEGKLYMKIAEQPDGANAIDVDGDEEEVYFKPETPVSKPSAPYVIFAGEDQNTAEPMTACFTKKGALATAQKYSETYKYTEAVYMPEDDIDTNEVLIKYQDGKKLK